MQLAYYDVNEAFHGMVSLMNSHRHDLVWQKDSRNGPVLQCMEPMLVTYLAPRRRVLFNPIRDANPFFHLFEALWMLAGNNLVEPVAFYNPKMQDYSDDGRTFHGAYGYRWRTQFGEDQLSSIAETLKSNPNCRRQVLQVWDCIDDLGTSSKDLPCNTQAYFSVRCPMASPDPMQSRYLDMTVCNRSNDLVWGMLGANVVHWSMLQEYMAARIGVEVGNYHQFTNNLHAYVDNWRPKEWLKKLPELYQPNWNIVPLVQDADRFDAEVKRFVRTNGQGTYLEPFLQTVAKPMCAAFKAHKARQYYGDVTALSIMRHVDADDWRKAGTEWIERRMAKWEAKSHVQS